MPAARRALAAVLLAVWVLWLPVQQARADVRLPHVIGNHMVLQRGIELPIWGWAEPGEAVKVSLGDQSASATAGADGRWQVRLPKMEAGGPHTLKVAGRNTIELTDVLVGEVWVCSGQSNMEQGINAVTDARKEVAAANYPKIRLFQLGWKTSPAPRDDVDANWRVCSPEAIGSGGFFGAGFSAAAYFFGRDVHKELDVPVGLIQTVWGGTRIEPWTPRVGFTQVPSLAEQVKTIDGAGPAYEAAMAKAVEACRAWLSEAEKALAEHRQVPKPPAWPTHLLEQNSQPTSIYNAMIHPLLPFGIRGAIWYQGEANAASGDGMLYRDKMQALVGGWRSVWGQGDFPFYYVQIAPFDGQGAIKVYSGEQVPRVWEAQVAAMAIPNTGMAVTNDIGDLADIHPKNKQEVGRRLALWALAKTYGRKDVVCCGPLYESMAVEGNRIRIRFAHAEGLASRDGKPLSWFTIAGADKAFVEAKAGIDGQDVVVSSEKVAAPVAVRFAWSMLAQPNLMNAAGLPASAFRTDQW